MFKAAYPNEFLLEIVRKFGFSPEISKVFIRRIGKGMTHEQISNELGISTHATSKRMETVYRSFEIYGKGKGKDRVLRKKLSDYYEEYQRNHPDTYDSEYKPDIEQRDRLIILKDLLDENSSLSDAIGLLIREKEDSSNHGLEQQFESPIALVDSLLEALKENRVSPHQASDILGRNLRTIIEYAASYSEAKTEKDITKSLLVCLKKRLVQLGRETTRTDDAFPDEDIDPIRFS